MPSRPPADQRQGLGDGVWRLSAALLQAWDVATDPEKQASLHWFSAVADVTESLLMELSSAPGGAAHDKIRVVDAVAESVAAVSPEARPPQAHDHGHGLGRSLDSAAAKLEELVAIQEHVAWTKRPWRRSQQGGVGVPRPSSAADVEMLMLNTVRILARCMELNLLGPEDRPSGGLRVTMCAAVLRVVGRCTIALEFRRSIQALQSGVFEIKQGSSAAGGTFRVKMDAVWPAPPDLQRSCFSLHENPGMLWFCRLEVGNLAILADDKRALQLRQSQSRWPRRKGITRNDLSELLQKWVSKGFRHKCAQQIINSDTYGREDIQESITMQLLSDDKRRNFCVICLAAKSGVGKTTLVRSVYNDQRVSDAFDLQLWLCMSDKFDKKVIMTSIIEHVTQVQCDVMELKLLRQLAKDELRERKFLLVLEDCHTGHHSFWKNISEIMKFGAKRSAIIITRKSDGSVYPRCFSRTPCFYDLKPLRDEHCLQIFQQFASGDGRGPVSDHDLSGDIIYYCGGNPLYLKAICGLLGHAKNALQLLDNLKEAFFPDLKLCFDLMPQHLKLCLSFCSLFPKDYLFTRNHLIRLWMSQGFINHEEFVNSEEIGTRYFDELICRSFFEPPLLHGNKEDNFVMPKLFHDMVTSISKDLYLQSENLQCGIPEKIRHLSLVPRERRTVVALHPVTKQVGNLDAFLVVNRSDLKNSSMSLPFLKLEGLHDFILKFKSLRTLNLSYTFIGQLPASIGNLKNLQYLSVSNTDIRRLPPELCLLENLQTLEVRNCPQLVTLPDNTKNLAKLRHLDVRKQPGYVRMPFGVGQLLRLQTLPMLNVGGDLSDCSIRELRDLDNLHGILTISGLENIKIGSDAKEAKLINKKHLKTLTLEWCDDNIYLEEDNEEISAEVFESLQPPSGLENLIVRKYCGSLFPVWIEKSPYDNLQSITLDTCYNCCMLPALGDLQSLRYLCLRKMYALRTFGYTSSLSEERSSGKFPALELLKLWDMYELDGWIGVTDGDFPRLHNVCICGCPILRSLPRLPSLVDLSLHRCDQLPEIPELVKLKSLKIEGFQDMVSLDLPQGLPALKNLEIIRCNELVSVVGLSTLPSVEKLKIVKCPKLDLVNNWQKYHFKKIFTRRDGTVIST